MRNIKVMSAVLSSLGLLVLFTNCSGGGGSANNGSGGGNDAFADVFTPSVYIECDKDVNPTCQYSSETANCNGALSEIHAYGVITRNSCDNTSSDFLAKSEDALLCSSFACTGGLGRWKDSNGLEIDRMPGGSANVCVYIDITCDGIRNTNDMLFQTNVNIHDDLAEIEALTWTTSP